MIRSLRFLLAWLLVTVGLSSLFIAPIPPGGVEGPYLALLASLPVACFWSARYNRRAVVPICFGLIGGFILSWPIFENTRENYLVVHEFSYLGSRIGAFTLLTSLVCTVAFLYGQRCISRGSLPNKIAPPEPPPSGSNLKALGIQTLGSQAVPGSDGGR